MEEDESSRPSTMIASIWVVISRDKFKKSARIRTGGCVSRHILAPQTSPSGNNPFYTLIHEHQIQKVPRSRLPSGWDIDRSNNAGEKNSKSWDSQADRFMSRIELNSEMIRNLSYKIDDLRDLIEKFI
jgi:hypothetical protein